MAQWKGTTEWEEVRRLGKGGQSEVFLVRDSTRIEERRKHLRKLMELSGHGFNEVRAKQFAEPTLGYGRDDRSSELGALKLYNPRAAGRPLSNKRLGA
jgi:hypothetical protein